MLCSSLRTVSRLHFSLFVMAVMIGTNAHAESFERRAGDAFANWVSARGWRQEDMLPQRGMAAAVSRGPNRMNSPLRFSGAYSSPISSYRMSSREYIGSSSVMSPVRSSYRGGTVIYEEAPWNEGVIIVDEIPATTYPPRVYSTTPSRRSASPTAVSVSRAKAADPQMTAQLERLKRE